MAVLLAVDADHVVSSANDVQRDVNSDTSGNSRRNARLVAVANHANQLSANASVHSDTASRNVMAAESSARARNVSMSELSVQNTVDMDTSRRKRISVSLNASAEIVDQLNAHESATMDSRNTTSTDVLSAADARDVNLLIVQNVVSSVTLNVKTRMDADSYASVNHVNQLSVQDDVTGDTSRNTNTDVASDVDVNHANQSNVQNVATGDTSDGTDTSA